MTLFRRELEGGDGGLCRAMLLSLYRRGGCRDAVVVFRHWCGPWGWVLLVSMEDGHYCMDCGGVFLVEVGVVVVPR